MAEGKDPVVDLEFKLQKLSGVVDLNDQRVSSTIKDMQNDIEEIKTREKDYVRIDNFSFYEKAFWIVATSTVSMLIGAIFYVITNKGGG